MPDSFPYEFDFGTTLKIPTREEVGPDARRLDGCYVAHDEAEATFVPTKSFMRQPPL